MLNADGNFRSQLSHSPPTAPLFSSPLESGEDLQLLLKYGLNTQQTEHLKINLTQAGKWQHTDFPGLRSSNRLLLDWEHDAALLIPSPAPLLLCIL